MSQITNNFAEATDVAGFSDPIGDALASMRVSGSLLLREAYSPPWGIAIPDSTELAALLGAEAGTRVVAFHLVEFGHCQIETSAGVQVLSAGQLAISFGGVAHTLSLGNAVAPRPVAELLSTGAARRPPPEMAPSATTSLLCGVFLLRHTDFNPLFAALPPLLTTTLGRPGELHNLSGVARLLAEEISREAPAGQYIVARLLEVFCAEAVRAYVVGSPLGEAGWIRGLRDPVVGRAIAWIHADPGRHWSVATLADKSAMSASRFAARFSTMLGESPMAYVARWRMNVARDKLARSRQPVDRIAEEVGYESLAAFNRAFKKIVGAPPARWRAAEARRAARSSDLLQ
ncbi:MAG: AraC family transcriptional regulator [Uliginosibacterium sp.]|nr:AraC family transcriptional regulator [Uliginosibacterium sp.]